jgi:hypothetical protein
MLREQLLRLVARLEVVLAVALVERVEVQLVLLVEPEEPVALEPPVVQLMGEELPDQIRESFKT